MEISMTCNNKSDTIRLSRLHNILNEITVNETPSLFEDRGDKIIFNVKNEISNKGLTTVDLLRRIPIITIDPNNNILLRGTKTEILLNGTPIGNVELLKQISSENIEKIEVILSPSAKYDAQGSSIINIITINHNEQERSLKTSINTFIGNRSSNISSQISISQRKISYDLNLSYYLYRNPADGDSKITYIDNPVFYQKFSGTADGRFYNMNNNIKFNISKKCVFLFNYTGSHQMIQTHLPTEGINIADHNLVFNRNVYSKNMMLFHNLLLENTLKLNTQNELKSKFIFNRNDNNNYYAFDQKVNNILSHIESNNPSSNKEIIIQTDFSRKNGFFECGMKFLQREMQSNFDIKSQDSTSKLYYYQNISSAYIIRKINLSSKSTITLGLRGEYTINFQEDTPSFKSNIDLRYFDIFPSMTYIYNITNTKKITFFSNKRILRPSIFS
jgi:hypothetical protein